ncbi:MAG: YqgE/AlgH family protein [Holosporaceae bacterium]|jgi:putative transcriptional regulator|nr:YqgE/AlgH family protein [Holosporaceae bacterium]
MIIDNSDIRNLTGKILIATPSVPNVYLNKTMVYICSHNKNGAMGIVINKLIPNMNVRDILEKLGINSPNVENLNIHFGGPEEIDKCFVLHTDDCNIMESVSVTDRISLTLSGDIIKIMMSEGGPKRKLLCMGCCVWYAEQLENEVASSYWVSIDSDEALIFGDAKSDKWSKALLKIGSLSTFFSNSQGNA